MHKTAGRRSHLDSLPTTEKDLCLTQIQMAQLGDTQILIACNLCTVQYKCRLQDYYLNSLKNLLQIKVLKTAIIYPYRMNVFYINLF